MDPKDQPQFNPKIPISEVLKQEQAGYTPSAPAKLVPPSLSDVVGAMKNTYNDTNNFKAGDPAKTEVSPAANQSIGGVTTPQTSQIKIIKTYRSDAEDAVKAQHASVARIAMSQDQQRRAQGEEIGADTPKKTFGLLITAIILIAVGLAAIPTVKYLLSRKTQEVTIASEKTIIPSDHQETLTLENATRDDLLTQLDNFSTKKVPAFTIEYVKFLEQIKDAQNKTTTRDITPDIFAALIGPNMPSALARSFDSAYMFGLENSTNPKTFLLFKTSSYEQTFANMLRWETKMTSDLSPVLNLSNDMIGKPFTDIVILNKDARAITAADGTIVFLYGFLDNQTLMITTSAQTFEDINSRYVAGRFVQ
ncbi:TPA: hypothetical protein DCQ44_03340 [Candidatus Taylorbacteria bacterium]|nr:hypothetical protein [Candidatus Taylorbacteria bacterium]